MTYSLHRPPDGLTGLPRLLWPLVYVQLVALKAWMRKTYGPSMPYWYSISRWAVVSLRRMPLDAGWTYAAHGPLAPSAFDFTLGCTSPRLALALADEPGSEVPAPRHAALAHAAHVPPALSRDDSS